MFTSTLPTTLSTPTWLANPLTILMVGLLLVGNPVPSHVTAEPASAQPATFRLAGLIATPAACRSAIALGMLPAQSPVAMKRQLPAVGNEIMDGLVTPPNWFPTSYRWPS